MRFQNAPTPLNGVIFTVIGRIIDESNPQASSVGKLDQPLDKLSTAALHVRTVIQIEDSLRHVGES